MVNEIGKEDRCMSGKQRSFVRHSLGRIPYRKKSLGRSRLTDEKIMWKRALRRWDWKSNEGKLCIGYRGVAGFLLGDMVLKAETKKKNFDSVGSISSDYRKLLKILYTTYTLNFRRRQVRPQIVFRVTDFYCVLNFIRD